MGFVSMFLSQTLEISEVCLQSLAFFSNQALEDLGERLVIKCFNSNLQWLLLISAKPVLSINHISKQSSLTRKNPNFPVWFFFTLVLFFCLSVIYIFFCCSIQEKIIVKMRLALQIALAASELAVWRNWLQRWQYFIIPTERVKDENQQHSVSS